MSRILLSGGFALGLLVAGGAQALTYDSHISRNGDGSAGFQDPDTASDNNPLHIHFSGGGSQDGGGQSPFLGSSDHNFAAPQPGLPFGGMIQGQDDR